MFISNNQKPHCSKQNENEEEEIKFWQVSRMKIKPIPEVIIITDSDSD